MPLCRLLCLLLHLSAVFGGIASLWPPPTSASWPKTSGVRQNYTIAPSSFTVTTTVNSSILRAAIARYATSGGFFFPFQATASIPTTAPKLSSLQISVDSSSETLELGVNEDYDIQVSDIGTAILHASTVFGALRGLETFAQLIDWSDSQHLYVMWDVPLVVLDSPRFPWRGLLIDTARHFIPLPTLELTIDAMAWSKLNTLHWHMWDAKSVPLQLLSLPRLSDGAYSNETVYTPAQIAALVQYGLERGIRVVPEMSMPGRTLSFGPGYPNSVALCEDAQFGEIVSLHPLQDSTYDLLSTLFSELRPLMPDTYVSLGGEQVNFECWDLLEPTPSQTPMLQYFLNRTSAILSLSNPDTKLISRYEAWQASPATAQVVEVYKSTQSLSQVLSTGVPALFSAGWHVASLVPVTPTPSLNTSDNATVVPYSSAFKDLFFPLPPGGAPTLLDFLAVDPTQGVTNVTQLAKLLGGLMAVWSYEVDYTNILSQTWPLAAAPAAKLWSAADTNLSRATSSLMSVFRMSKLSPDAALDLLSNFRCRIVQRGLDASAVRPDFCPLPPINSTQCPPPPPQPLPFGQYRLVHVALVGLFSGIVGIILGTILANCYRRLIKKLDAQSNFQRRLINNHEML